MPRFLLFTFLIINLALAGCQSNKTVKGGFDTNMTQKEITELAAKDPFPRADQPIPHSQGPQQQQMVAGGGATNNRWR